MGRGPRFHSSLADQRYPVLQTPGLPGEPYEQGAGEPSGFKPWAIFREDNHNLSSLSSSWVELTSLSLTEKRITIKVFSSPASLAGICVSEFFYILSNYADKTSLWFKPSLTPRRKYTEVIPTGQGTHLLDDRVTKGCVCGCSFIIFRQVLLPS